jgi:DNA-binding MarR family transcriptional regulator
MKRVSRWKLCSQAPPLQAKGQSYPLENDMALPGKPLDDAWHRADPAQADFRLDASPFYWLTRISGRYMMEMSQLLRGIGMDVPRWRVLMILAEHEPASISTLSEEAVINLSTMTKMVQRMEANGLVTSAPRATDARVTEVLLTDSGRAALPGVRDAAGDVFRHAFDTLDGDQIERLVGTLRHVFENLDARRR